MNCQAFHQSFSDYLDGTLDAADTVRVRRHLEACGPCRRLEAAYRAGVEALREAERPCPAREFSVRIVNRVRRERRLTALTGGYGVAGALLLCTLVAVVALDLRGRDGGAPPGDSQVVEAVPVPPAPVAGRFDRVTFRVRDASELPPGDLYAVLTTFDPDPSYRVHMEVPAVWSGR
ncbi:MAG: anti-sigma factor [Gemmatimonadales bacterium]|jgi:anti-sigma factor RsiW